MNISGMWTDRGIQCFNEIKDSSYDLDTLPENIVSEIANYLNLEYGAPESSKSLDTSEAIYIGEYPACGVTIKIWKYPCGKSKDCYVGVQPWKDGHYIGTVNPDFDLG